MIIYIDIETMPGQAPWVREQTDSTVAPPGNYSKPETIEKWWKENGEDLKHQAWHKTGLDATLGEIAVIAIAIEDGPVMSVCREPEESERELIEQFYADLSGVKKHGYQMEPTFCGHNVLFDLGFIWRRSVVHGIRPCKGFPIVHDLKPWSKEIIDTCQMWKGSDKSTSGSMKALCKAFGIEGKGDIDGSKVWDEIEQGNLAGVVEYCEQDVERVREIHKRLTFQ